MLPRKGPVPIVLVVTLIEFQIISERACPTVR